MTEASHESFGAPEGAAPRQKVDARKGVVGTALAFYLLSTLAARRRGYNFGGSLIVRCRQGHLFTTIWIPGVSLKAIRLGWARLQRCPVGPHWSLVTPVRDSDLTDEERALAQSHRDVRIP